MAKNPNGTYRRFLLSSMGVDTDECIVWPFPLPRAGYASLRWEGQNTYAHRVVCKIAHGAPPTAAHEVAHSCGNRSCINQKHLRWASRKENHADKKAHGTYQYGERHPRSVLSQENVDDIRARVASGTSQRQVAIAMGVSPMTISRIVRGETWSYADAAE